MPQQSSINLHLLDIYDLTGRTSKLVVSGAVAASVSISTDSWATTYYVVAALGNAVLGMF